MKTTRLNTKASPKIIFNTWDKATQTADYIANVSQIGIVWIIVGTLISVPADLLASYSIALLHEMGQWIINAGECGFLQAVTSAMGHISLLADLVLYAAGTAAILMILVAAFSVLNIIVNIAKGMNYKKMYNHLHNGLEDSEKKETSPKASLTLTTNNRPTSALSQGLRPTDTDSVDHLTSKQARRG